MRWVLPVVVCVGGCNYVFGVDPLEEAPDAGPPAAQWLAVDGGDVHTCGIKADHTLWCWGRNDNGQLGIGDDEARLEVTRPAQVGSDATWAAVAAGGIATCALKDDATLWCWGRIGEYFDSAVETRFAPAQVPGSWTSVAVGRRHACAVDAGAALSCWGNNEYGQLGDGTINTAPAPVAVSPGVTWSAVAAGTRNTCGLHADGTLWCWGTNDFGTLGVPGADSATPIAVGTDTWTALALGGRSACAVRAGGALWCWGDNRRGQLGDLTTTSRAAPQPVGQNQIADWAGVSLGDAFACGRREGGELLCWGDNRRGQLGSDLATTFQTRPTAVEGTWTDVQTGSLHACAIDAAGHLSCVGNAGSGALGDGVGSRLTPSRVGEFTQVSAGVSSTCAVDAAQRISCWGDGNGYGVFGDGTATERQAPSQMPGAWTKVSVGDGAACAIDSTQQVQCWGRGETGMLGTGAVANTDTPGPATGAVGAIDVHVSNHVCATTATGALQCWGYNYHCQAGQPCDMAAPTFPIVTSPSPVASPPLWKSVSGGAYVSAAVDSTQQVYTFGTSSYGLRGISPSPGTSPAPAAVGIVASVVSTGEFHVCAAGNGEGWCWGINERGQLGTRTTQPADVPVKLQGAWSTIDAGALHSCGIKSEGSLWCWGDNTRGQLGTGSLLRTSEPTQVGTDLTWTAVDAGASHTCAIKSDGLYCWGANHNAAVGDGTAWRADYAVVGG